MVRHYTLLYGFHTLPNMLIKPLREARGFVYVYKIHNKATCLSKKFYQHSGEHMEAIQQGIVQCRTIGPNNSIQTSNWLDVYAVYSSSLEQTRVKFAHDTICSIKLISHYSFNCSGIIVIVRYRFIILHSKRKGFKHGLTQGTLYSKYMAHIITKNKLVSNTYLSSYNSLSSTL